MIFLGIDPGKTGALASIDSHGVVVIFDFSDKEWEIYLRHEAAVFGAIAVIESVHSMPGQGVASSFTFGVNFGFWQGFLSALQIPFDLISPQKWQKEIFDSAKKTNDRKAMALERARRLFPEMATSLTRKKDDGRADALLIAECCKRQWIKNNVGAEV